MDRRIMACIRPLICSACCCSNPVHLEQMSDPLLATLSDGRNILRGLLQGYLRSLVTHKSPVIPDLARFENLRPRPALKPNVSGLSSKAPGNLDMTVHADQNQLHDVRLYAFLNDPSSMTRSFASSYFLLVSATTSSGKDTPSLPLTPDEISQSRRYCLSKEGCGLPST